MKAVSRFLPSVVFFLLIGFSSFSQPKGSLKGRVYDLKNNQGIPFANVQVYSSALGTATDTKGYFEIDSISPGYIRLEISCVGYKTILSEEYMVNTAFKREVEIGLEELPVSLEQVTVKASPYRKTAESPLSVQRIGISEIEKNPGGNRDISKVLQSMPGVLSSPAFRNDFIVRGGGPSENRFYLDDVELPTINHFATQGASGGVVSIINVDFVKEVNFYAGAFPASRGNLLSSLLDFQQTTGNPDRIKVRATLGATDYGLSLDGPLTPTTTFLLSARRSYLKMLFSFIGLPFLPVYNDFQFKTATRFNQKNELILLGIGGYDINRLNKKINHPDDNQEYILGWLPESRQWSYTLGAVYKQYGNSWQNLWVISRSELKNKVEKYSFNDKKLPKLVDYNSGEAENKFRFEHKRQISSHFRLTAGVGIEYATYRNSTFRVLYYQNQSQNIDYNRRLNLWKWSFFGQVVKTFGEEKFTLSFGLRGDATHYAASTQNIFRQISPRLSLSYALHPKWFLHFNTGRYYQLPSYTTMGYADEQGELINKRHKLRYIGSNHYVAGIEFRPTPLTRITVEGFYKTYDHYPVSLLDSVCLANKGTDYVAVGDEPVKPVGEGRSYGIECMLRTQEFYGIIASVAYTFYYSEFKKLDHNLRPLSTYIPSNWDNRHIFTLTASRKFKQNWDVGLKWRYVGKAPYTPWDIEMTSSIPAWDAKRQPYYDFSRFNAERLPAFHQLDMRVDKSFFFRKWSLILYADIQNIYHYKSQGPPLLVPEKDKQGNYVKNPDREGYYQMRYIKNEIGGTILPSVGIIIDF